MVEAVRRLPFADRLGELAATGPSATGGARVVVHGDASTRNLLWHRGAVVALLDSEWARLGPADLELQPFLADMAEIAPGVPAGPWLAEDYPRLFTHPHLVSHLWLYDLASALRVVLLHPPRSPEEAGRPDRSWPAGGCAAEGPERRRRRLDKREGAGGGGLSPPPGN